MTDPTDEEIRRVANAIAMCSFDNFEAYAKVAISEMRAIERERAKQATIRKGIEMIDEMLFVQPSDSSS